MFLTDARSCFLVCLLTGAHCILWCFAEEVGVPIGRDRRYQCDGSLDLVSDHCNGVARQEEF